MNVFHEVRQNSRIDDAAGSAQSARLEAENLRRRVIELEHRVDRLALVSQALWELLRDRARLSDADVYAKVNEIDLRDGSADGKIAVQVTQCPNCHRPVNAHRTTCLYCGAQFTPEQLVR